jgi:hypothetical protein
MRLSLASMPNADAERIRARLGRLLVASGVRRRRWRALVVCLEPGLERVVPRAQLAAEFGAAGLEDAAHEVLARRVGPVEVLVYALIDSAEHAAAGFIVVDLGR